MNGKKRIPYAHVLYAAALTALLSACAPADRVQEAGTISTTTHAAAESATDMPEIVITASSDMPEVVIVASRQTEDVAG